MDKFEVINGVRVYLDEPIVAGRNIVGVTHYIGHSPGVGWSQMTTFAVNGEKRAEEGSAFREWMSEFAMLNEAGEPA